MIMTPMINNNTMNNEQNTENTGSTFLEEVSYKYLPYWPLFVFSLIVFMAGAWAYLSYTNPVYIASSTLLINDEKKGADENKIEESINLLTSNKVVDNEIEVLHSRKIMQDVVNNLHLYAPLYVQKKFSPPTSAYTISPVSVEVDDPEKIVRADSIYFNYNSSNNTVVINSRAYPLALEDKKLLIDPIVVINFLNFRVTVLGEVGHPMVVSVPNEKISLLEAIGMSGDLTPFARRDNVLLIREEKGKRLLKRINLNSGDIFNSPYYYLKSNDIVYAEPNKARVFNTSGFRETLPLVFSFLTVITLILYRLKIR